MTGPASPDPAKPAPSAQPAADGPFPSAIQPFSPSALLPLLLARFPAAKVELVPNPGTAAEHSLLLDAVFAPEIARFLRDDPALRLDYCSNVTGVDWLEKEITDTVKKSVPASAPVAGVADPGPASPRPVPVHERPFNRRLIEQTSRISHPKQPVNRKDGKIRAPGAECSLTAQLTRFYSGER